MIYSRVHQKGDAQEQVCKQLIIPVSGMVRVCTIPVPVCLTGTGAGLGALTSLANINTHHSPASRSPGHTAARYH